MISPLPQLEWIKPPQQARSQATLERLLDAAEALIIERGFDEITIVEVVHRAHSSVGAFYARFTDKEALLRSLFRRFVDQAAATVEHVLDPARWGTTPMATVLELAMAFLIRIFHERRGLVASFLIRGLHEPEYSKLGELIAVRALLFFAARGLEIRHPDPEAATRFAVFTVLGLVESRTLAPLAQPVRSEQTIAAELVRMCLAYLGIEPTITTTR